MIGGAGPRKLDLTKDSVLPATAKQLWPVITDVARWPAWFRDAHGQGLARAEKLPHQAGAVHASLPELGQRFRFAFTNGLEGEFKVTYWTFPSQISLGLVPDTRKESKGIEGFIIDCDLFPLPDGTTKLWFGALLLLEKGFRPSLVARWPKREVMGWVDGFHAHMLGEAQGAARGPEAEAAAR
ncbi:MAG TPA: SRPBCC family protein [Candidatus Thermoplasmatota archaeon]|jgi:hypothetical protein|nr:SRPBCC family protein [Candidatus Thermoplasmatota archaeon]